MINKLIIFIFYTLHLEAPSPFEQLRYGHMRPATECKVPHLVPSYSTRLGMGPMASRRSIAFDDHLLQGIVCSWHHCQSGNRLDLCSTWRSTASATASATASSSSHCRTCYEVRRLGGVLPIGTTSLTHLGCLI